MKKESRYKDGEPCKHIGCLSHIIHPCEGCGRIGGHYFRRVFETDKEIAKRLYNQWAEETLHKQTFPQHAFVHWLDSKQTQ